MALQQTKPTSPARRFVVKVTTPGLHKGKPHAPLVEQIGRTGGRKPTAAERPGTRVVATSSSTG